MQWREDDDLEAVVHSVFQTAVLQNIGTDPTQRPATSMEMNVEHDVYDQTIIEATQITKCFKKNLEAIPG